MPIGAFSTLSQLSHRALRLYAEEQLLAPAYIDNSNGYRFYRMSQLADASRIRQLRELDMPLSEIRELNALDNNGAMLQRLNTHWQRQTQALESRQQIFQQLVQQLVSQQPMPHFTTEVQARPAAWLLEMSGQYTTDSMRAAAGDIFARLHAYAASQNIVPSAPGFLACADPMLADTAGEVRFCLPLADLIAPKGDIVLREEPACQEAVLCTTEQYAFYPELLLPIEALVRAMLAQNLPFDGSGLRYCWVPASPPIIRLSWTLLSN